MMFKKFSSPVSVLALVAVVGLSGCASVNSISLTPVPAERSARVKTEKSKLIILGFNFDNDFIDDAVDDLKAQCPNGRVTGLLTKDENIAYFLFFVWKKRITATGYCVSRTSARARTKSRGTASESSPAEQASDLSEEGEL